MIVDQEKFQALFEMSPVEETRCVIRAVDVKKVYRMGQQETHALRGASVCSAPCALTWMRTGARFGGRSTAAGA